MTNAEINNWLLTIYDKSMEAFNLYKEILEEST
jgi:hypothetical protein